VKQLAVMTALLLASCGTLPQPFYGNPGPAAEKLAIPPAPVLMIPAPPGAMLDDASAQTLANDLAAALVNFDVPSVAGSSKNAWHLSVSAKLAGSTIIPHYIVLGPDNKSYGAQDGAPAPAAGWANGDAATLQTAAQTDAKTLVTLLAKINAQVQGSDPNSLENRTPRVYLAGITGAPGDGDESLALDFTRDLAGVKIVQNAAAADFSVHAIVHAAPDPKQAGEISVEIDWIVQDSNQRNIGQVTQLHDLAQTDMVPYWGDTAAAAAAEAAGGVAQVIANATLKKSL
jgi:hypothetical protein